MTGSDLLVDHFGRIRELVHDIVDDLGPKQLAFRADPGANPIQWLVWHLTRVQDDHLADAAGIEQVWTAQDWVGRFGLTLDRFDTGFGHDADEVAAVSASGELLTGYHDAVHEQTVNYVDELRDTDLDRILDEGWDPPVSLGARLVSVIGDNLQHAGQAAFVRGIAQRTATA